MRNKRIRWAAALFLLALVVSSCGGDEEAAKPTQSPTPSGVTATDPIRGTSADKIETRGTEPFDVAVHEITIAPGGDSGWHSHPGQAIVVVKSGTFTTYRADDSKCSPTRFEAGKVYIDPGYGAVHIGRNESTDTPTVLQVTYIDVPVGGAFRANAQDPGTCPFQSKPGASATDPIRGTSADKIETRGTQPFDVAVHEITIAPGGDSGWHSHPGQAIVVVKSGTFTTYRADDSKCSPTRFEAGKVYIDPGYGAVHIGRNESTDTPTVLQVTYVSVPVGGPFRTNAPKPGNCSF